MDTSIKENPTHFFGDNGRLMSLKKLAKVNGHGIFYPPPTAFVNGLLLNFFFSQERSYKSENSKKKGVKFRFTDNNEAYLIEDIPLMDTYID